MVTGLRKAIQTLSSYLIRQLNFIVLYDMSCFYSNFVLPYIMNLDRGEDRMSPKHDKIAPLRAKIAITQFCKGQCIRKLVENRDVKNIALAEIFTEKVLSDKKVFHMIGGNDSLITPQMIKDFHDSDKKYEDSFYISTANYYEIPIVTSEKRKLPIWKKHCRVPVVSPEKYWTFIKNCASDLSVNSLQKKFARSVRNE